MIIKEEGVCGWKECVRDWVTGSVTPQTMWPGSDGQARMREARDENPLELLLSQFDAERKPPV